MQKKNVGKKSHSETKNQHSLLLRVGFCTSKRGEKAHQVVLENLMCVWPQYYNMVIFLEMQIRVSEYRSVCAARVRRRTKTVTSSSVSKSLYDEKMSKRRLAWGSLAASQVAKTGHLRILLDTTSLIEREYDDTCDSCCVSVGLPLSSSFYSFTRTTTTPSFQRRRRGNTHTNEDDTLFMHRLFYSPIIIIGCLARTISLSHHPICSSFSPLPLSLKTTKKQNDCCCFC